MVLYSQESRSFTEKSVVLFVGPRTHLLCCTTKLAKEINTNRGFSPRLCTAQAQKGEENMKLALSESVTYIRKEKINFFIKCPLIF
jgi:hypothetical protein